MWDTFFDVSKTREFWVVFSKYGEYNEKSQDVVFKTRSIPGEKY